MNTPPARPSVPGTPPSEATLEPQAGCSLEELRISAINNFKAVGKDATDLEVRAAAQIDEVQARAGETALGVQAAEPPLKGVNVHGSIKDFVTQTVFDTRRTQDADGPAQ